MSFLPEISVWLKDNDLAFKAVAALAAPGGIWFWIDKFRNRIRIKIRQLGLPVGDASAREITFEAENISSALTSFEPKFTLVGYTPKGERLAYSFTFDGADRQLPSHVPKQFLGRHNNSENRLLLFLLFMTFTFPLSRGGRVRVRVRHCGFKTIGFLRFHLERLRFLWFGKAPE